MCSLGARGLLVEMMAIMHEAEPYGYLIVAGKALDDASLAKQVGAPRKVVEGFRTELERGAVIKRNEFGVLFSPRMIRDEDIRLKRANGGKLSADHPNVPPAKDTLDGYPSEPPEDIHDGPPHGRVRAQPDARGQKQIKTDSSAVAEVRGGQPVHLSVVAGGIMGRLATNG